ncbi:MAG: hypothetical protein ACERKV_13695 [Clostridiaceae bacterium]
MNNDEYMVKLESSLEKYFDIEKDKEMFGRKFDIYGKYYIRSAKYVAVKTAEIYAFTSNEYLLYNKSCKRFEKSDIEDINRILKEHLNDIIDIDGDKEHMSSNITFLVSCEENPDKDTIKAIKKFKFYKSFAFAFKGWVNVKIIFVNPMTNNIFTNKLGRREKKKFSFESK